MASNLEKLVVVPGTDEAPPEAETTARCACCGVSEECTAAYVGRVRAAFCGDWLCGLCGEAVKERMLADGLRVEAALAAHEDECREFNSTTRLNPTLSLAGSMRGIARRSFDRRRTTAGAGLASASCQDRSLRTAASRAVALARSASCDPRFLLSDVAGGDDGADT